jgi:lysophospholipase L1-like esterase
LIAHVYSRKITINKKKFVSYISILLISLSIAAIIFETSLNGTKTVRVACIGDSITREYGYPGMLQALLGDNYTVENFGSSSSTVLFNTAKPYMYEVEFTRAKEFQPDIAVVMLGTNDARTDYFKSIDKFVSDYQLLIDELQALKSKPKIFLVTPPPLFNNTLSLENVNLVEGIIPRIEQIADEKDLPIIDVYSILEDHPEYFPDGVHPNSEGATIMADMVYNAFVLYGEAS